MTTETQIAGPVGQRVRRKEDRRLVTGRGKYAADVQPEGCLHLVFVRSPVAHGRISFIDASSALELEGVVGVWTADDIMQLGAHDFPISWITAGQRIEATPLLARGKVRFAGQQVAVVVASDPYLAEDAAERVRLDIAPLAPVSNVVDALAPDAPLLHEEWPDNVVAEVVCGGGDIDAAFEQASVTVQRVLHVQRQAGVPMENRAVTASYDPATGRVTAYISTQGAHHAREVICRVCGWDDDDLRVICPDVGGGFGTKEYPYAEEALVCLMTRTLKRPVKWVEDRREAFLSQVQARQMVMDVELAADASARILGVRGSIIYDVGGHPSGQGIGPARFGADVITGPYRVDAASIRVRGVVTNKAPVGAYRGYGAPQTCFAIERLIDELAARLQLDGLEVRRRNLLEANDLPRRMPSGLGLDSGDYRGGFERVVDHLDVATWRKQQRAARADGRLIGLAVTPYVMGGGLTKSKYLALAGQGHGAFETVLVRMDSSARLVVQLGSSSQGQGHETALAQVAAEPLGLDAAHVRVVAGDTDMTPFSPASALASRVAPVVASAVYLAAERLAAKVRRIAAFRLECEPDEVRLLEGHAESNDASISLREVSHGAHTGFEVPDDVDPGLECTVTLDPPDGAFSYGTHGAVVEVDPLTGAVQVLRYVAFDDCGRRLNPMVVEGQIIGGIAQGLGGALLEDMVYDHDSGQPLTTSFLDYLLPVADTMPDIELLEAETPAVHLPVGAKGVGEAGTIPPAALLATAVEDAVRPRTSRLNALPLAPQRVLELVDDRER